MDSEPDSAEVLRKRALILVVLLGLLCLFTGGLYVYLGSARAVSIGHFELERRPDTKWSYWKGEVAARSPSGTNIHTGDVLYIGTFSVTRWRN